MVSHTQAIVLAAGASKRFNTTVTKLVAPLCGKPMIGYIAHLLDSLTISATFIVGYQKERVREAVIAEKSRIEPIFITQAEQRGTGDALCASRSAWNKDTILIINGDMPLLTPATITHLYEQHSKTGAVFSFVTAHSTDASSAAYGRVIEHDGQIEIVEARNFSGDIMEHCCVNAGIYLCNRDFLEAHSHTITQNEVSAEWYITDLVKIASTNKLKVTTTIAPFDEIRGINTLQELWATEHVKRAELVKYWMGRGVRFASAHTTYIDVDSAIGVDTTIGAGVHVLNKTVIGKNCTIKEYSTINNSILGDNVVVKQHSVIEQAHIADSAQVGPFAHIHSGTTVGKQTIMGNFVEVKNSIIGEQVKAKHLTYLGDALLGNNVNIGAGTITCNHDGVKKHKTIIHEYAYIGSNNTLIAPLTIHAHAFTAAGSTITEDVPSYALALGRARQVIKHDYAKKLRGIDTSLPSTDAEVKPHTTPSELI